MTYTPAPGDAGHQLSCQVAAASSYGLDGGPVTSAGVTVAGPQTGGTVTTRSASDTVTTPSTGGPTGSGPAAPTATHHTPVLAVSAREARKVWRERLGSHSRARTVGTQFSIRLGVAARLTLTFRHATGHRTVAGIIDLRGHAGAVTVRFSGRIDRRHRLAPGATSSQSVRPPLATRRAR